MEIEVHADMCAKKAATLSGYANLIWDVFPQCYDILEPDNVNPMDNECSSEFEQADRCILEGDVKKLRSLSKEDTIIQYKFI